MRKIEMLTALCIGGVALAGCSSDGTEPTTTVTPTPTPATTAAAAGPIDCAAAVAGSVEAVVCGDPDLTALDQQAFTEYQKVQGRPGADLAALGTAQTAWLSNRAGCATAADVPRCLTESYQTRLFELRSSDPAVPAPPTVTYRCPEGQTLTAVFYNDVDPAAAVVTRNGESSVLFAEPAASGAKYGREGVEFWEHQGEVTVLAGEEKLVCRTP